MDVHYAPLPFTDLLDPSPHGLGLPGTVHIPLDQLADRSNELPQKGTALRVVAEAELVKAAIEVLEQMERPATGIEPGQVPDALPGTYRLWQPNPFLQAQTLHLPPGNALDLGCGTGRDAVYLASRGWQVTAIDKLGDAAERGRELESRYAGPNASSIVWQQADLKAWQPTETFDLIAMFFFLHRPLVKQLPAFLSERGLLLVETFTDAHRAWFGKPNSPELVLQVEELEELLPGSQLIVGWHEKGHTARIACRNPRR